MVNVVCRHGLNLSGRGCGRNWPPSHPALLVSSLWGMQEDALRVSVPQPPIGVTGRGCPGPQRACYSARIAALRVVGNSWTNTSFKCTAATDLWHPRRKVERRCEALSAQLQPLPNMPDNGATKHPKRRALLPKGGEGVRGTLLCLGVPQMAGKGGWQFRWYSREWQNGDARRARQGALMPWEEPNPHNRGS